VVFSGYSINKTDRHEITEILLKVVLKTINHKTKPSIYEAIPGSLLEARKWASTNKNSFTVTG
jgi:hypothetical protein